MPAANTLYAVSNTWIQEVKYKGWGKLPTNDDSTVTTDQSAWAQFRSLVEKSTTVSNPYNTTTIVSTYSLVYTATNAYHGGVLAPNGDIHFVPASANRGQKVSAGVVSTYSLVYTASNAYRGGVLAPNGDIHFVPASANRGQKISAAGVVSTYSLVYTTTTAYAGGVLAPNGDIHFVPTSATIGQKININSGIDFPIGVCLHPFYNKL